MKRFFQINSIQFDTHDERPAGGRTGEGTSKKAGKACFQCVDSEVKLIAVISRNLYAALILRKGRFKAGVRVRIRVP